ncbi:MAG: hypothetical protein ACJA1A_001236 [Saprospiraceae bacterium]|jgi:hypothetical protein|tara:strand:+ start:264 stop:470 length:207 start_codon:yes stop_codon:yes gene_type:complete
MRLRFVVLTSVEEFQMEQKAEIAFSMNKQANVNRANSDTLPSSLLTVQECPLQRLGIVFDELECKWSV